MSMPASVPDKLVDRRYDRENLLIHDYFFAKTIDKVRAGGVIAFVTSNGIAGGTMDPVMLSSSTPYSLDAAMLSGRRPKKFPMPQDGSKMLPVLKPMMPCGDSNAENPGAGTGPAGSGSRSGPRHREFPHHRR